MNTSEIRAVLADLKIDQSQMSTQGFGGTCANCIAAIETLLAREVEAVKAIDKLPTVSPLPHNDVILYNSLSTIRAILEPEEKP
jgi:bacterioferritin-associated ferredoxin